MSQRHHTISIGVHEYTFISYSPKKAIPLLQRLMKILGETAIEILLKVGDNGGTAKPLDSEFSGAIMKAVKNLDGVDLYDLLNTMITDHILKDGKAISFDLEFTDNYGVMMKLLVKICIISFSSFFTESGLL